MKWPRFRGGAGVEVVEWRCWSGRGGVEVVDWMSWSRGFLLDGVEGLG